MNEVITETFIVRNPKIDNVRNVLKDYVKKPPLPIYPNHHNM